MSKIKIALIKITNTVWAPKNVPVEHLIATASYYVAIYF